MPRVTFATGASRPHEQPSNIFRSENMAYVQIYMQQDVVASTVRELGLIRAVQFEDLNAHTTAFQRQFADDVKRCDELERVLRWLQDLRKQLEIRAVTPVESTEPFDEVEARAHELEAQLSEATSHIDHLTGELNANIELREVLQESEKMVQLTALSQPSLEGARRHSASLLEGDLEQPPQPESNVRMVCGTIAAKTARILQRVVLRATRGNCLMRFSEKKVTLTDPATKRPTTRAVFIVFFTASRVEDRIRKVVEALQGSHYVFPNRPTERHAQLADLARNIADVSTVLERTKADCSQTLQLVAGSLHAWYQMAVQQKAVFHAMNMFSERPSGVVCEGWCVERRLQEVRHALQRGMEQARSSTPSILTLKEPPVTTNPPTYYRTNRLTSSFQAIVDAYGVADYKELNPTPFMVVTFPFLFAVMFGDIGHGTLMTAFAVWMVWKEKALEESKPGEIFGICFSGRYVILLMGLFSIYTGFLYNEIFSLSANMFQSPYSVWYDGTLNDTIVYHVTKADRTYPFGMDPVWKQSINELTFTNSMKMKMSVVLGVLQMLFGILLSALNYVHKRDWVSLIHVFVPQVLFLSCVFGYMVVLIIVKWATHYDNTSCAPSILTTFINMFLAMGSVEKIEGDDCTLHGALIENQVEVQQVLLIVAVMAVPWLLFAKPIIERRKHSHRRHHFGTRVQEVPDAHHDQQPHPLPHPPHEEYDFGEEMVHNIIHTIEFVLGAVSNTASYLRLWALSLAHGQLSTVFWEKTLVSGFQSGQFFMIVPSFFIWAMCTLGVLMVMESLSAFLHALRLHWVEFQNKFYHGTGTAFAPFTLVAVAAGSN